MSEMREDKAGGTEMKQKKSWELTDEFWEAVQDLLIRKLQEAKKAYQRKSGD
jgi:hypothetical protein